MTIDHPLRRTLARMCSPDTMSRVVDPILADARWEDGRLTARAILALVEALALHAITSLPGWLVAACSNDSYALVRATAFMLVSATVLSAAMTSFPIAVEVRRLHTSLYAMGIRLFPQGVVVCLPSMLVLTIPTVFGGRATTKSIVGRTLLLTVGCLALCAALTVVVVPRANQAYREVLNGRPLPTDPNETGFARLRAQIRDMQKTHGGRSMAQRMEYAYQTRAAVMVSAIPFGIAGIAIVALTRRRGLSVSMAACALLAYWTLMLVEDSVANAQIIRGGFLPEYLCAWTPNLLLLIASCAILGVRHTRDRLSTLTAA
jgi:hypothetical protein